ncbi:MAG: hypothetical protein IID36_08485 [Planctomycetes bacterium]|nr:hypothetical protein [Planctomycetota bacterium]
MTQFLIASAGADTAPAVPLSVTLLFAALLLGLIVCLALEEKIHAKKSIIAGVFAIVCLFLANVDDLYRFTDAHKYVVELPSFDGGRGHMVELPVYIPAIDWGVIGLIFGASLFIDVTSKSGLFTWIAIKLTKASKGDPRRLLWFYGLMTVVFSAVLNNVAAMIIVGSLTGVSLGKLGRKNLLLGFLMIEGLLTNVGGLLTLISSVPNIIIGNAAGISFVEFFIKAAPFVSVATVLTIMLGAKLFKIEKITEPADRADALRLVGAFDENDGIESWGLFWFGAVMLALFILTIATTSVLPVIRDLGMSFVALSFAAIMLVRYKSTVDQFYRAVDWDLLGFFAALFVVINVMEHALVLDLIGTGLTKVIGLNDLLGYGAGTGSILVSSAAASSVTDNIPLAAMLSKILQAQGTASTDPLWWAVVFGCNLGGNLTPIGSASTLVAVTIMHKNEVSMSFGRFVGLALPFAIMQIVLATAYVLLFLA